MFDEIEKVWLQYAVMGMRSQLSMAHSSSMIEIYSLVARRNFVKSETVTIEF